MTTTSAGGNGDIWVGTYDGDGTPRWSDVWAGPYGRNDWATGVAVDDLGRVFVHGTVSNDVFMAPIDHDYEMIVLAYSPDGDRLWEKIFSGEGSGGGNHTWDYSGPMVVDPRGFLAVAGMTMTPQFHYDVVVRLIAP